MQNKDPQLKDLTQNERLPIRIISPGFGHLSVEAAGRHSLTHRKAYYFLLLMLKGAVEHTVDLVDYVVENNELLFVLPHQIHQLPENGHGEDYFKLGFDSDTLARLPRQYPFLVDPLNHQKIGLSGPVAARVKIIFGLLLELLSVPDTDPELILAQVNSLLTEINFAYFAIAGETADDRVSKFIGFKVFVENNLTGHLSISEIAGELAMSTDSLYQLVKRYSGLSPKEFLTNRLILEARRRLHYGESASVKEMAFELGFNDPDYFSRLFKKVTGKTISDSFQDLS